MSSTPVQESYIFRRNAQSTSSPLQSSFFNTTSFNWKNLFIIALVLLLIVSFLGINILYYAADGVTNIFAKTWEFIMSILGMFGYSTGYALDKTSETVATVAKTGIDIADGTVDSVAKLMMQGSKINGVSSADTKETQIKPTDSSNPIQQSISAGKQNWCLVGEDQGVRSCVLLEEYDKCMSGQIFPDKQRCIMPTGGAAK